MFYSDLAVSSVPQDRRHCLKAPLPLAKEGLTAPLSFLWVRTYAVVTATIRFRFNGRSTVIECH